MKNYFLSIINWLRQAIVFGLSGYIICFASCSSKVVITKPDYVEGKGYCIEKYDKMGCNICKWEVDNGVGSYSCEARHCEKVDKESANKCLQYQTEY